MKEFTFSYLKPISSDELTVILKQMGLIYQLNNNYPIEVIAVWQLFFLQHCQNILSSFWALSVSCGLFFCVYLKK